MHVHLYEGTSFTLSTFKNAHIENIPSYIEKYWSVMCEF